MDMILYEDKDLIVCHKRSGIPVQSARIGQKDMVSILNNYLAEKSSGQKGGSQKNGVQEIFVVHRLDQPVEGAIVFAKNKKAAAGLSKQIADGSMKKVYQAVCCVTEKGEQLLEKGREHTLTDYLVKNGRTNSSSVAYTDTGDAKKAELSFRILAQRTAKEMKENQAQEKKADQSEKNIYLLAEINLKTGRHHQIRVQMSHAGLPLYGDQKYHENWTAYVLGKPEVPEQESFGFGGGRTVSRNAALALCSVKLTFRHPSTGKQMIFETRPTTEAFRIFE